MAATGAWVIASLLFSVYVSMFADFNQTYGSLGAVIGLLLWFYVTAFVVLLGAELNAEMELQTECDTTTGEPKPMENAALTWPTTLLSWSPAQSKRSRARMPQG